VDAAGNIYDIASNADAFTRLLDMVVVTRLLSLVWVEDGHARAVFGERAAPLEDAMRHAPDESQTLAGRLLTLRQLATLEGLIQEWRRENHGMTRASFVRFSNFAVGRGRSAASEVLEARELFRQVGAAGQADTGTSNPGVPHTLGVVKWSDLYDPEGGPGGSWRRVADMNWFREYHAVTLLIPDGRVITTGGTRIKFQVGPTSADIEGFVPPYLFRGVRPQITSIWATRLERGRGVTMNIAPATTLTSAVLVSTGTHTHWVDTGTQRRVVLPVNQNGPTAEIDIPQDPNLVPAGYYMRFAMVDDIPSVARIVQVVTGCSQDFNGDTDFGTDQDIEAFFACLGWNCCPTCLTADFNGDGDVGTDQDIESFFRVLGGAPAKVRHAPHQHRHGTDRRLPPFTSGIRPDACNRAD